METVSGSRLAPASHLRVVEGSSATDLPTDAIWVLRGVTSNERYVTRAEHEALASRREPLGRPGSTRAALIPSRNQKRGGSSRKKNAVASLRSARTTSLGGSNISPRSPDVCTTGAAWESPSTFSPGLSSRLVMLPALRSSCSDSGPPRNGPTSNGRSTSASLAKARPLGASAKRRVRIVSDLWASSRGLADRVGQSGMSRHRPGGDEGMCFRRSRYLEERAEEARGQRVWDLFHRETRRSEPPVPVVEREDKHGTEPERDEVPAGAER
jgi:hypothetical protein